MSTNSSAENTDHVVTAVAAAVPTSASGFEPTTSATDGSSSSSSGSSNANLRRRVKLYVLNDDRQWDDRGTGYVSSAYIERLTGIGLWVVSELDGSTLLESRIQHDTAYQKQQETLIVWSEAESLDLALSFQEKEGCEEVWARICWVQGKDPSVDVTQDVADDDADADEYDYVVGADSGAPGLIGGFGSGGVELPACETDRLAEAVRLLASSRVCPSPMIAAMQLADSALRRDYPRRLCCDIFPEAESRGDSIILQQLYELITCLLMLNNRRLLEDLTMSDQRLLATLGMLEYRPSGRVRHRDFVLGEAANPRHVLAFDRQPGLADRIRRQYRLQYLLDSALPPPSPLDDVQFLTLALRGEGGGGGSSSAGFGQQSELSGMVLTGRLRIASDVVHDAALIGELFEGLCGEDVEILGQRPTSRMLDLARFLRELCCCCPSGQCGLGELAALQERLLEGGRLLDALSCMFKAAESCAQIGSAATDVLQCLVDHSAPLLRDYILRVALISQRPDSEMLLNRLVDRMRQDTDPEMSEAHRLTCLIRALLDPDAALTNPAGSLLCPVRSTPVKPEFLRYFYQRVMPRLMEPLISNTPLADDSLQSTANQSPLNDSYRMAQLQHCILSLAMFSAEQHANHFRGVLLTNDLMEHSLILLRSRHSFLALSAIRLLRRFIATKDDLYHRCLIGQRLMFDPVLELLTRNGVRYNMVHSAVLELLEFVLVDDIAPAIVHIVESEQWQALLGTVKHSPVASDVCQSMLRRYHQLMEKANRECAIRNKRQAPDSPIVGSPMQLVKRPRLRPAQRQSNLYRMQQQQQQQQAYNSSSPSVSSLVSKVRGVSSSRQQQQQQQQQQHRRLEETASTSSATAASGDDDEADATTDEDDDEDEDEVKDDRDDQSDHVAMEASGDIVAAKRMRLSLSPSSSSSSTSSISTDDDGSSMEVDSSMNG